VNDILAGDPAPTNPTAAVRDDILAGLRIAEAGSIGDETPEELLARYDAAKRAEVLAKIADLQEATAAADVIRRRRSIATGRRIVAAELRRMAAEGGESRG
jgi:hypothetical protein